LYSSLMSLSTLYCLFFPLYSSASHPDHPSFPTRRSSDLRSRTGRATTRGRSWVSSSLLRVQPHLPHDLDDLGLGLRKHVHQGNRSEEHTSELQSRFDLVCRLLLEKKKKTLMHTPHTRRRP